MFQQIARLVPLIGRLLSLSISMFFGHSGWVPPRIICSRMSSLWVHIALRSFSSISFARKCILAIRLCIWRTKWHSYFKSLWWLQKRTNYSSVFSKYEIILRVLEDLSVTRPSLELSWCECGTLEKNIHPHVPVSILAKYRELKPIWIWDNRPSRKDCKLLFLVVKANKNKLYCPHT